MLERIGAPGFETISKPNLSVLKVLDGILEHNRTPVVYEIGVGVGATTLPIAKALNNNGQLLLFSRAKDVLELSSDLRELGFSNICDIWGSANKTYSGYHFELARGFVANALPEFDLAYIDGGHVFHLDGPATCILKELCNPGGYMVFDDWNWTLAKSPTMNPEKRPATTQEYDELQIKLSHVQLVCLAFMDRDVRYRHVASEGNTRIYQRKSE
jgi:predicted O-methyltransferase YrrM